MRSFLIPSFIAGISTMGCFVGGPSGEAVAGDETQSTNDETRQPGLTETGEDGDTDEGTSNHFGTETETDTDTDAETDTETDDGDGTGICGDGTLDSGEECDDGNANNLDECVDECVLAICGDGHVHSGQEQCDDGNDVDTDACTSECAHAACGDGHLQAGTEECDDGNVHSLDGCSVACMTEWRYVFVTSETYSAHLGGVMGADALCNQLADASALPGNYMAWLSDSSSTPSERFTHSLVPYRRIDGLQVAASWAALIASESLDHSLSVTDTGENVEGVDIWTDTYGDGTSDAQFGCADWTSAEGSALVGNTGQLMWGEWTVFSIVPCSESHRLYCFQQ